MPHHFLCPGFGFALVFGIKFRRLRRCAVRNFLIRSILSKALSLGGTMQWDCCLGSMAWRTTAEQSGPMAGSIMAWRTAEGQMYQLWPTIARVAAVVSGTQVSAGLATGAVAWRIEGCSC